jgi:hypothetical protein
MKRYITKEILTAEQLRRNRGFPISAWDRGKIAFQSTVNEQTAGGYSEKSEADSSTQQPALDRSQHKVPEEHYVALAAERVSNGTATEEDRKLLRNPWVKRVWLDANTERWRARVWPFWPY